MGEKNPFRFPSKQYSFLRFATLIDMDKGSKMFQNIMKDLCDLRKKFLNTDYPPLKQKSSLQLIESKLKKRYPHIFEGKHGPKHLYFALHVIMHYHDNERSDIKKRLSMKREDASAPTNNKHSAVSSRIRRIKEPLATAKIIDLTDEQNIDSIIRDIKPIVLLPPNSNLVSRCSQRPIQNFGNVEKVPTSSRTPWHRPIPPKYIRGTSSAPNAQRHASGSSQPNHAVAIQNLPKEEDVPTTIRQADIYKFLSTCRPPMTHYLRRFVDFGWVTNDYLRSVSRGRAEQRYKLLKKILESGSCDAAVSPSEMDIAILEHHLDTYFVED